MKRIFLSLVCIAFACSAMAFDLAETGTEYSADGYKVLGLANGKVAVTVVYLTGEATEVIIPATVHATWKGTEACDYTFEVEQAGYNDGTNDWNLYVARDGADAKNIYTTVTIDNGVQKINAKTFENATALKYLTLPASITSIGNYAFGGCEALTDIYCHTATAPAIGTDAFKSYGDAWDAIINQCTVYVKNSDAEETFNTTDWSYWKEFYDRGRLAYNSINLYDNYYDEGQADFYKDYTVNVTLNRTFKAGQWHTLCVPFAITAWNLKNVFGDDVEVAYLESSSLAGNDLTLNFAKLTLTGSEPEDYAHACAPYLVKPSQDVAADMAFSGVYFDNSQATTMVTDNAKFIGSFSQTNLTADQYFMGNDNNLYTREGVWMGGYRAYFEFNESVPAGVCARVVMQGQQTTGLEEVQEAARSTKVMENGVLYIIKNGVRYNAQGQMVK